MGLLDIASGNSFWRGYDYYKAGKVKESRQISSQKYEGTVLGSENNIYDVMIDLEHPKKSVCNCLHAEGSRRVCKHKVALYFFFFPEEAEEAIRAAEEYEAAEEQRMAEELKEIEEYVNSLSKQELREELIWRMMDERERRRDW